MRVLFMIGVMAVTASLSPAARPIASLDPIWSAVASGVGRMVTGPDPLNLDNWQPMKGTILVQVMDTGPRWSDGWTARRVDIVAEFSVEDSWYRVVVHDTLPQPHPLGEYAAWFAEECGQRWRPDPVPSISPGMALWGWAKVSKNGAVIAAKIPAYVLVMTRAPVRGVALEVATKHPNLAGVPNGYRHVMWPDVTSRCGAWGSS
ncbi:MAG: hypothetical protein ACT4P5_04795 [Armatimonadota bacterium]